jgi:hypothetical protein
MKSNDPKSLLFDAIKNNKPENVRELLQNPIYHNLIISETSTLAEMINENRSAIDLNTTDRFDKVNKLYANEDISRQIQEVIINSRQKIDSLNNAVRNNDLDKVKELVKDPTYSDILITEERNLLKLIRQNRQASVDGNDHNKLGIATDIYVQINAATNAIKTNKTQSLLEGIKENNLAKIEQLVKDPTYRDALVQGKDNLLKEVYNTQKAILTKQGDGSEVDKANKRQAGDINQDISVLLRGAIKDAEQKVAQEDQDIKKEIEQEKKNVQKPGLGDRINDFFTKLIEEIKNIFSSEKKAESNITPNEQAVPKTETKTQTTIPQLPTITKEQKQENQKLLTDASNSLHKSGATQGQSIRDISSPQASQGTNPSKEQGTGR